MITPTLILFYVAAALTLAGALVVVISRNIVYAAFGLLASMVGVAGLFLIAFAEFLALAQLLIYGGAVVIVILFALMLTRIEDFESLSDHPQWPIAALVAIAVFGVIAATIAATAAPATERAGISFAALGSKPIHRLGSSLRSSLPNPASSANRRHSHGAQRRRPRLNRPKPYRSSAQPVKPRN